MNKQVGYASTGLNPHLSIYQFYHNGVSDFSNTALWWEIMGCGPCMDAPTCIPAGGRCERGDIFIENMR